jgi:RHS repeat-associated protein
MRRDPSAQELQDGINQLAAAGAQGQSVLLTTAQEMARSLFIATNYETSSPVRTDLQYIGDLYYSFLQRGPEPGGLSWWVTQLQQPSNSRANVCNDFAVSPEFQALVAALYGTAASDNERTDHFVNNFYLGAYGRDATATELQQQRDALNAAAAQGQAQVQAQAEAMGRALFAGQINERLSDTQFVTNLYEGFLQRGPDTEGLTFWTQVSVGQGRQHVLDNFATCAPFRELSGALYREANWLVADHLGTPRMVVNKSGALAGVKRHDYLPFGEELGAGGRTPAMGYGGDSVRQKFTQYPRDTEITLDYAQARYFSNQQARFTSPDPYLIFFDLGGGTRRERSHLLRAYLSEPKNWNRYSYCLNNPLNLFDPTGLVWLTRDNMNYFWVDDDKYKAENWPGYKEVPAGTIAFFAEGWGGYADKYRPLLGHWVTLKADGSLASAGINDDVDIPDEYEAEHIQAGFETFWQWTHYKTDLPDVRPAYAQGEIDWPGAPIKGGIATQFTLDRNGNFYTATGAYKGTPGFNIGLGWLGPNEPAANIRSFLEGNSVSGAVIGPECIGGGVTYSSGRVSPQIMLGTPGTSFADTYGRHRKNYGPLW